MRVHSFFNIFLTFFNFSYGKKEEEKSKLRFSQDRMGGHGGARAPYPTWVWSPSGGWWNDSNPHWKRNSAVAFVVIGVIAYNIAQEGLSKEVRGPLSFFFYYFSVLSFFFLFDGWTFSDETFLREPSFQSGMFVKFPFKKS